MVAMAKADVEMTFDAIVTSGIFYKLNPISLLTNSPTTTADNRSQNTAQKSIHKRRKRHVDW